MSLSPEKKEIVETFIAGCLAKGLTFDEAAELAAHLLCSTVSMSGSTSKRIEVVNVGAVEVEC